MGGEEWCLREGQTMATVHTAMVRGTPRPGKVTHRTLVRHSGRGDTWAVRAFNLCMLVLIDMNGMYA